MVARAFDFAIILLGIRVVINIILVASSFGEIGRELVQPPPRLKG